MNTAAAATPFRGPVNLGPVSTRFSKRMQASPIVLAPMGGCAGGELAAAVSLAGGIGLVGSGGETLTHLRHEWHIATHRAHTRSRLGFGLNINQLDSYPPGTLETLLSDLAPQHVYLSFGDCTPYAPTVLKSGATLYSNCDDSESAIAHARAGVTCVVAQGSDAGGHTGDRASVFALVPQVRSALDDAGFGETLLVAAAAADAVVLGTALVVAEESMYTGMQKRAVVETGCGAAGTTIGTFIDSVRGISKHSSGLPGRCISNESTRLEEEWIHADADARKHIMERHSAGVIAAGGEGLQYGATWAGAACGLVNHIKPASEIIDLVLTDAAQALTAGASLVQQQQPADTIPINKQISESFASRMPALPPSHRRIYLLRHGETEWNRRGLMQGGGHDIPLNAHGADQASCASSALSTMPLDVIASSHLMRAVGTADTVRERHPSAEGTVLPDLGEMRFGEFEGIAIHGAESTDGMNERFGAMDEQVTGDVRVRWPGQGGESTVEVEVRARRAVGDVLGRYPGAKHVALVGHGRTNKVLLASLLYEDPAKFKSIEQGNACINVIDFEEETSTWKPVVINYTDHADVDVNVNVDEHN